MALNTIIKAARKAGSTIDVDKLRTKSVLVHGIVIDMNAVIEIANRIDYNIRKMKRIKRKRKP